MKKLLFILFLVFMIIALGNFVKAIAEETENTAPTLDKNEINPVAVTFLMKEAENLIDIETVHIKWEHNKFYLTGVAFSVEEAARAYSIATSYLGKGVINQLKIEKQESSDEKTKPETEKDAEESPGMHGRSIITERIIAPPIDGCLFSEKWKNETDGIEIGTTTLKGYFENRPVSSIIVYGFSSHPEECIFILLDREADFSGAMSEIRKLRSTGKLAEILNSADLTPADMPYFNFKGYLIFGAPEKDKKLKVYRLPNLSGESEIGSFYYFPADDANLRNSLPVDFIEQFSDASKLGEYMNAIGGASTKIEEMEIYLNNLRLSRTD